MSKRKKVYRVVFSFLSIFILLFFWAAFTLYKTTTVDRMVNYALRQSQFKFSEFFTFDWDVAYLDTQAYGYGGSIKELSGYEFNVGELGEAPAKRFLFFKNGRLVREIRYTETIGYSFPKDIVVIYPDTVFDVVWATGEINGLERRYISFEIATE